MNIKFIIFLLVKWVSNVLCCDDNSEETLTTNQIMVMFVINMDNILLQLSNDLRNLKLSDEAKQFIKWTNILTEYNSNRIIIIIEQKKPKILPVIPKQQTDKTKSTDSPAYLIELFFKKKKYNNIYLLPNIYYYQFLKNSNIDLLSLKNHALRLKTFKDIKDSVLFYLKPSMSADILYNICYKQYYTRKIITISTINQYSEFTQCSLKTFNIGDVVNTILNIKYPKQVKEENEINRYFKTKLTRKSFFQLVQFKFEFFLNIYEHSRSLNLSALVPFFLRGNENQCNYDININGDNYIHKVLIVDIYDFISIQSSSDGDDIFVDRLNFLYNFERIVVGNTIDSILFSCNLKHFKKEKCYEFHKKIEQRTYDYITNESSRAHWLVNIKIIKLLITTNGHKSLYYKTLTETKMKYCIATGLPEQNVILIYFGDFKVYEKSFTPVKPYNICFLSFSTNLSKIPYKIGSNHESSNKNIKIDLSLCWLERIKFMENKHSDIKKDSDTNKTKSESHADVISPDLINFLNTVLNSINKSLKPDSEKIKDIKPFNLNNIENNPDLNMILPYLQLISLFGHLKRVRFDLQGTKYTIEEQISHTISILKDGLKSNIRCV